MITERRQYHRKTFTELVSVQLGSHNSGLILNASEGGLAFHAGSPIQPREELHFTIALDRSRKLEGYGRLEWTDGNATTAGLQFTDISEDVRNEIRLWLAETNAPAEEQERAQANPEVAPSFFAADMLRPASRVELPKEEDRPVPQDPQPPLPSRRKRKSRSSHTAPSSAPPAHDQPADAGPAESPEAPPVTHPEENISTVPDNPLAPHETSSESPFAKERVSTETVRRASASLHRLSQTLQRESRQQADGLIAGLREAAAESERCLIELREFAQVQTDRMKDVLKQAAQVSQRLEHLSTELEKLQQQKLNYFEAQLQDLSDRHFGELQQRSELFLANASAAEMGRASRRTNGWMMTIMFAGLIVLLGAMLLSYHREAAAAFNWIGEKLAGEIQQPAKPTAEVQSLEPKISPPQQPAARPAMDKDARALWSKAAKGDTAAEVALARLYLAGKGVVKSCVQARLLLGAAADKGNQDATQLLGQLERAGCP